MNKFWEKLKRIFQTKELRNKVFFVLALIVVFRIVASIPVPGVDAARLKSFLSGNQLFGLYNLFSGGGMSHLSIAMLGIGPYITAEIILELLTMVFPKLEAMHKQEGEAGRQKFEQIVRYLTVPLAMLQGFAMIIFLRTQQVIVGQTMFLTIITVLTVTAGTIFLMWLGELMTEKNIGHGISILIFAGIVAGVPSAVQQMWLTKTAGDMPMYIGFLIMSVLIVAGIVVITEGQRNIPVIYARRNVGNQSYGGSESHVPLRVNQAGMIPIIFAMSLMILPGMFAQFFAQSSTQWLKNMAIFVGKVSGNQLIYGIVYFLLVIGFTYFYTAITFDPKQIAESLQKQGGFVPGVRPGRPTADFLNFVMNRITLAGAVFLGIIAVLPFIGQAITHKNTLTLGGAGVLIVVGVALEIMHQINGQLVMRDYEEF